VNKPTFENGEDVASVLGASSHVLATVDEMEHAIRALRARSIVNDAAVLSQTQESLTCDALDLVADRVAFESCVDEVKRWYWNDHVACEGVMVTATTRFLDMVTSDNPSALPEKHTPWVGHMLDALLQRMDTFKLLEEDALRDAARRRGFDLIILPERIFKRRRVFSPDLGEKRSVDGSRAPSPVELVPSFMSLPGPTTLPPLDMPAEAVPCEVDDCPAGSSGSDQSLTPTAPSFDSTPSQPERAPLVATEIAAEIMQTAMHLSPDLPPQTSLTKWSISDMEPALVGITVVPPVFAPTSAPVPVTESQPAGPSVTLPVRSGVASSIHNPANAITLDEPQETRAPVPLPMQPSTPPSVGEEVAKALDPVFAAIMTTLAWLTSGVESLGTQKGLRTRFLVRRVSPRLSILSPSKPRYEPRLRIPDCGRPMSLHGRKRVLR